MVPVKERYHGRQREEDRKFWGIFYPDSTSYDMSVILNNVQNWTEYYYILHDKDVYSAEDVMHWNEEHPDLPCPHTEGELKKPHYHILVVSSYPKVLGLATVSFGLHCSQDEHDQSHIIERVSSVKQAVRYLTHIDHPDKYQYDYHDIVCKKGYPASRFFVGADFNQDCRDITNFIKTWDYKNKGVLSYSYLMEFLLDKSLIKSYIRNQVLFNRIIDGNNQRWLNYCNDLR